MNTTTILNSVISEFDKFGILPHTLPNAIGMWPNEQECLVWSALKSSLIHDWMEIGSFCGGSTVLLALAKTMCDTWMNCLNKSKVIAVDNNFNPMFDYNVFTRGKFQDTVIKLQLDSYDVLRYYNGKISFLFIDGYHSFERVLNEFRLLQKIMTEDCIIAFHDVSPKMTYHNINTISDNYDYAVANYHQLGTDTSENFRLDEAVSMICKEYGYVIMDIPIRDKKTYFKETKLDRWVRGTTSPYNSFTAIRRM